MKALVTGGAGFIGSHIADALLARGCEVRVLDSLEPRVHPNGRPNYVRGDVEFIQGDVRDRATLESALAGIEIAFHQAAYQDYMPDYGKFFHSNVVSTALIFELIREKRLPVQKVVVASSQSVYGEGQYECATHRLVLPEARPIEQLDHAEWDLHCPKCQGALLPVPLVEAHPNPAGAYGISKFAQEMSRFAWEKCWAFTQRRCATRLFKGAANPSTTPIRAFAASSLSAFRAGKAPVSLRGRQTASRLHSRLRRGGRETRWCSMIRGQTARRSTLAAASPQRFSNTPRSCSKR